MTDQDNPWNILEIDPTEDKKAIKKAYAVLIKQYKPDEHPEEFQEIQQAYKMALQILKSGNNLNFQKNNKSETNITHYDIGAKTFPKIITRTYLPSLEEKHVKNDDLTTSITNDFESDMDRSIVNDQFYIIKESIYENFENMINSKSNHRDKKDNWYFLNDYLKIDNLNIRKEIEYDIFERVGYLNQHSIRDKGTLIINENILSYFDSIFNWSDKWMEYSNTLAKDICIMNFDMLLNNPNHISKNAGSEFIKLRVKAFIVDHILITIALLLIFSYPLSYFNISINENWISTYLFVLVTITRLILELLTRNHITIGKKNYSLTVVNKNFSPCSKRQLLIRYFVLCLQIFSLIIIDQFYFINKFNILHFIIALVVISNGISFLFSKKLIHDLLSKTLVIKMKQYKV